MGSVRDEKKRIVEALTAVGVEEHEAACEAQLIVEYACGFDRLQQMSLSADMVPAQSKDAIDEVLRQRLKRVPLQYCLGYTWFMGSKFKVQKGVLIPRTDTEILVDVVQRALQSRGFDHCFAGEIGIGSGIISISLLERVPTLQMFACDIDALAVQVAQENALEHGVAERLTINLGDWKDALPEELDVLVSNPPYIPLSQKPTLQSEVRHEPDTALFAGADGLDFYREIAALGKKHLRQGRGFAFVEAGDGQAELVIAEFERHKWVDCDVHNDVNGLPRVVSARAQ